MSPYVEQQVSLTPDASRPIESAWLSLPPQHIRLTQFTEKLDSAAAFQRISLTQRACTTRPSVPILTLRSLPIVMRRHRAGYEVRPRGDYWMPRRSLSTGRPLTTALSIRGIGTRTGRPTRKMRSKRRRYGCAGRLSEVLEARA